MMLTLVRTENQNQHPKPKTNPISPQYFTFLETLDWKMFKMISMKRQLQRIYLYSKKLEGGSTAYICDPNYVYAVLYLLLCHLPRLHALHLKHLGTEFFPVVKRPCLQSSHLVFSVAVQYSTTCCPDKSLENRDIESDVRL